MYYMGKKILFLLPYPLRSAPSQRFRFEQYFTFLRANHFEYRISSFLATRNRRVFATGGNLPGKALALVRGFSCRIADLCRAPFYDFVFIHREACPIGPPIFEWVLKHVIRRKIIYDFDDAIWLSDKLDETSLERRIKWRGKVKHICRWSFKVSCGNKYLYNYACMFNVATTIIPSVVDTRLHHNPDLYNVAKTTSRIRIGWTGSYSTLKYLTPIKHVIASIQARRPHVTFIVIGDHKPEFPTAVEFIPWNADTEINDLLKIDIGIMPLPNDEWALGKGGFKCIQYSALKIPAVASYVGVNREVVEHGVTGFLARSTDEWTKYLELLIDDDKLRETFGKAGREKINKHYSVDATASRFLSLFE